MTPRLARRLLILTVAAIVGYVFRLTDQAYGPVPFLVLALVLLAGLSAGYGWAWANHSAATAEANRGRDIAERDYDALEKECEQAERERDDACAIAVSLQEGAKYEALPAYIDKAEADRLNRHLRSLPVPAGDLR